MGAGGRWGASAGRTLRQACLAEDPAAPAPARCWLGLLTEVSEAKEGIWQVCLCD